MRFLPAGGPHGDQLGDNAKTNLFLCFSADVETDGAVHPFKIGFGIAVGLTSTNLGTLSRYRSPILPFFAILLLVLQKPRSAPVTVTEARAPEPQLLGPA